MAINKKSAMTFSSKIKPGMLEINALKSALARNKKPIEWEKEWIGGKRKQNKKNNHKTI